MDKNWQKSREKGGKKPSWTKTTGTFLRTCTLSSPLASKKCPFLSPFSFFHSPTILSFICEYTVRSFTFSPFMSPLLLLLLEPSHFLPVARRPDIFSTFDLFRRFFERKKKTCFFPHPVSLSHLWLLSALLSSPHSVLSRFPPSSPSPPFFCFFPPQVIAALVASS